MISHSNLFKRNVISLLEYFWRKNVKKPQDEGMVCTVRAIDCSESAIDQRKPQNVEIGNNFRKCRSGLLRSSGRLHEAWTIQTAIKAPFCQSSESTRVPMNIYCWTLVLRLNICCIQGKFRKSEFIVWAMKFLKPRAPLNCWIRVLNILKSIKILFR